MRRLTLFALMVAAGPVLAQGNPADPDKKVAGGGQIPAGWSYRLEYASTSIENVKFVPMGNGVHFTVGPAGIYWREADAASGSFHAVATLTRTKAPEHPEAYGLLVAGKDLKGPNASYIYFIVRGQGEYSIRKGGAAGAASTNLTQGGTRTGFVANDAVAKADSAGKATDQLEISGDVKTNKLTFKINGKTVQELDVPGGVTGLVGLRINHNLDVHVDGFAVHKM